MRLKCKRSIGRAGREPHVDKGQPYYQMPVREPAFLFMLGLQELLEAFAIPGSRCYLKLSSLEESLLRWP